MKERQRSRASVCERPFYHFYEDNNTESGIVAERDWAKCLQVSFFDIGDKPSVQTVNTNVRDEKRHCAHT